MDPLRRPCYDCRNYFEEFSVSIFPRKGCLIVTVSIDIPGRRSIMRCSCTTELGRAPPRFCEKPGTKELEPDASKGALLHGPP